jgi:hypothetical protein
MNHGGKSELIIACTMATIGIKGSPKPEIILATIQFESKGFFLQNQAPFLFPFS